MSQARAINVVCHMWRGHAMPVIAQGASTQHVSLRTSHYISDAWDQPSTFTIVCGYKDSTMTPLSRHRKPRCCRRCQAAFRAPVRRERLLGSQVVLVHRLLLAICADAHTTAPALNEDCNMPDGT